MELSKKELQTLLNRQKGGYWGKMDDLKAYESRLRVLSEPLDREELSLESGWVEFTGNIKKRVAEDKFLRVISMFDFPLPVTSISTDIMKDLNRVWDSRNANFFIQYPNNRAETASKELEIQLNTRKFVEKTGRIAFKSKPQTIVVVDKDEEGKPYYINVGLDRLRNYDHDGEKFLWIAFTHSNTKSDYTSYTDKEEKISFYDDEYYRVVTMKGGVIQGEVQEMPHNLGYCPARWFIDVPLNSKKDQKRFCPLGQQIGIMGHWQEFETYGKYNRMYSTFNVVEYAASSCEDENCRNGKTRYPLSNGDWSDWETCQACSSSVFNGPGTAIRINPAIDPDENDERGYFRFISPDIKNAEYNDKTQKATEQAIKLKTTGSNNVIEKEAVNDAQISALMEDRKSALLQLSSIASRAHEWLLETALLLWLELPVPVSANYGTDWFLLNEAQLQALYDNAKKIGLPESEINQIYDLLIETKYKAQPRLVQKLKIENNVNPAPHNTLVECYEKVANGVMQQDDLYIKANFPKFVMRFERENGSIVDFGKEVSFEKKINSIIDTFINYVKDEKSKSGDGEG